MTGVSGISAENFAGGFTGSMANSYAVDCSVSGVEQVHAEQEYAGGFTGFASLGTAIFSGTNILETVRITCSM